MKMETRPCLHLGENTSGGAEGGGRRPPSAAAAANPLASRAALAYIALNSEELGPRGRSAHR